MFRKLLLGSVAALGLMIPVAAPASADAQPFGRPVRPVPPLRHVHRQEYRVFYRLSHRCDWTCCGKFYSRKKAFHFADSYRRRGFDIDIRGY